MCFVLQEHDAKWGQMMRYILVATALGVALLGAWAIIGELEDKRATPELSQPGISLATAEAVRAAEEVDLGVFPTTAPSDLLRRDVMIDCTMGQARAMGEQSPRLEDVRLVNVAELADINYVSLGEEASNYGPPSKQVYVVRLAGRFTPLDLPYEVDDTWPRRGIAYTVYDAVTGDMLGGGLMTDSPPAETPPVSQ